MTARGRVLFESHWLILLWLCRAVFAGEPVSPGDAVRRLRSADRRDRVAAAVALARRGPAAKKAVSALAAALGDQDAEVRCAAAHALGRIGPAAKAAVPPLCEALGDDRLLVRRSAAEALGSIGPPAVPALFKVLGGKDATAQVWAARALWRVGGRSRERALAVLLARLQDRNPSVRSEAALALSSLGSEARAAVRALTTALGDRDPRVCLEAAVGLLRIDRDRAAEAALPALRRLIDHRDAAVRLRACRVLALFGPAARGAVSALATRLRDDDADVRLAAAEALGRVGSAAVGPLLAAATDRDPEVRLQGVFALGLVGGADRRVLPALTRALRDDDREVRSAAALGLARMGPAALFAVPALLRGACDADWQVRTRCHEALVRVGRAGIPHLVGALESPDALRRVAAARALWGIGGSEAGRAVPALIRELKHRRAEVRRRAARGLAEIGSPAKVARGPLRAALADREAEVQRAALEAVVKIAGEATALRCVLDLLDSRDVRLRAWAAETLGGFGPAARSAVPALIRALKDDARVPGREVRTRVRELAASALGEIGPAAVEPLVRALGRPDPRVRAGAAAALGRVRPPATKAIGALEQALLDDDREVRDAASASLKRIRAACKPCRPTQRGPVSGR